MEFVLVHGTAQGPAGWDRLAGALRSRGHTITLIDLPASQPEWSVADYAAEAAAQAGQPTGRRVVAGHSGAGVLLPAIAQVTGASAAVWLAAYIPDLPGGQSMADDIAANRDDMFHRDWLGVDPVSDQQAALRYLFHDCDPPTQDWALGTRRLFNPGLPVYQHQPGPLPPTITPRAIVPTADRTLRPDWLRQAARQRLGGRPVEVSAGHCPHVSQPETIADILLQT